MITTAKMWKSHPLLAAQTCLPQTLSLGALYVYLFQLVTNKHPTQPESNQMGAHGNVSESSSPLTQNAIPDVAVRRSRQQRVSKKLGHMTEVERPSRYLVSPIGLASNQGVESSNLVSNAVSKTEAVSDARRGIKEKGRPSRPKNLASLDIVGLLESHGFQVMDKGTGWLLITCPWAEYHTKGDDKAYVREAVPENNWPPRFKCHHFHCDDHALKDVLDLFSEEEIAAFC